LRVNAMTKLCEAPAAIDAGVFGEPVSALVAGLVVCYIQLAFQESIFQNLPLCDIDCRRPSRATARQR
jgi:hypothetical protein